jgi:hypothetical protein
MFWIGPPLVTNSDACDYNKTTSSLLQIEKQQEEELAAIRDFKPEIDVTYGYDEENEQEEDDINIVAHEVEGSEEDDTSTQQAADDEDDDLGFVDVDDSSSDESEYRRQFED